MMKNAEEYIVGQLERTYRSTEVFVKWLEGKGLLNDDKNLKILDMAAGGVEMYYIWPTGIKTSSLLEWT